MLELKLPPDIVVLITGVVMWLARFVVPGWAFALPGGVLAGAVCFVVAFTVASAGVGAMQRAETTLDPTQPGKASALVQSGIYRYTRNPIYLGMLLALIAWALLLRHWVALVFLPGFVLYMNRFQIGPEERALTQKFGNEYTQYKATVRRWL